MLPLLWVCMARTKKASARSQRIQPTHAPGLAMLAQDPLCDPARVAAIGYCFGGSTVMQLAYSGAELKGVVSFHGSLPLPKDQDAA